MLSRRGCQGGVSEIGRGVDSVDDHDVHTALVAHVGAPTGGPTHQSGNIPPRLVQYPPGVHRRHNMMQHVLERCAKFEADIAELTAELTK